MARKEDSREQRPTTPTGRFTPGAESIPVQALLSDLPEGLRGGSWSADGFPNAVIQVDRSVLLDKLRTGRVTLPLGRLMAQIPAGWVRTQPQAQVELNLAQVLQALPQEIFQVSGRDPKDTAAAKKMRDYFAREPAAGAGTPAGTAADTAAVPSSALLAHLPEEFRGKSWKRTNIPKKPLEIERSVLLERLRAGRAVLPLDAVAKQLPAGWVRARPGAEVELDLAEVVRALPPEIFQTTGKDPEDMAAAAGMRDCFQRQIPLSAASGTDKSTAKTRQQRRDEVTPGGEARPEGSWDGVEPLLESAPQGVDINTATRKQLSALPGVTDEQAREIVKYRKENGRFTSIFGLAQVPGFDADRFELATGLSASARSDRHEQIRRLLGLKPEPPPSLEDIAAALSARLSAAGCLVTNSGSTPLAATGCLAAEAERHAALGAHFSSEAIQELRQLIGDAADCVILPCATPALTVVCADEAVVLLAVESSPAADSLALARQVMAEIGWLLRPRAVVRTE